MSNLQCSSTIANKLLPVLKDFTMKHVAVSSLKWQFFCCDCLSNSIIAHNSPKTHVLIVGDSECVS